VQPKEGGSAIRWPQAQAREVRESAQARADAVTKWWRFHCAGICPWTCSPGIGVTRKETGAPHPQKRVRFAKLGTVPKNNKREGSPPNDS